jgi:hypothetical protein
MNEKDFEKLAELLKANEQKLDNLLKKRSEKETDESDIKDDISDDTIEKIINQLDI